MATINPAECSAASFDDTDNGESVEVALVNCARHPKAITSKMIDLLGVAPGSNSVSVSIVGKGSREVGIAKADAAEQIGVACAGLCLNCDLFTPRPTDTQTILQTSGS